MRKFLPFFPFLLYASASIQVQPIPVPARPLCIKEAKGIELNLYILAGKHDPYYMPIAHEGLAPEGVPVAQGNDRNIHNPEPWPALGAQLNANVRVGNLMWGTNILFSNTLNESTIHNDIVNGFSIVGNDPFNPTAVYPVKAACGIWNSHLYWLDFYVTPRYTCCRALNFEFGPYVATSFHANQQHRKIEYTKTDNQKRSFINNQRGQGLGLGLGFVSFIYFIPDTLALSTKAAFHIHNTFYNVQYLSHGNAQDTNFGINRRDFYEMFMGIAELEIALENRFCLCFCGNASGWIRIGVVSKRFQAYQQLFLEPAGGAQRAPHDLTVIHGFLGIGMAY